MNRRLFLGLLQAATCTPPANDEQTMDCGHTWSAILFYLPSEMGPGNTQNPMTSLLQTEYCTACGILRLTKAYRDALQGR